MGRVCVPQGLTSPLLGGWHQGPPCSCPSGEVAGGPQELAPESLPSVAFKALAWSRMVAAAPGHI